MPKKQKESIKCHICKKEEATVECSICGKQICFSCVANTIHGDLYRGEPDEYSCENCWYYSEFA